MKHLPTIRRNAGASISFRQTGSYENIDVDNLWFPSENDLQLVALHATSIYVYHYLFILGVMDGNGLI